MTHQTSDTATGAALTLRHALGFASIAPFPFAVGPTSLRLRRLREQRAQEAPLTATALKPARTA